MPFHPYPPPGPPPPLPNLGQGQTQQALPEKQGIKAGKEGAKIKDEPEEQVTNPDSLKKDENLAPILEVCNVSMINQGKFVWQGEGMGMQAEPIGKSMEFQHYPSQGKIWYGQPCCIPQRWAPRSPARVLTARGPAALAGAVDSTRRGLARAPPPALPQAHLPALKRQSEATTGQAEVPLAAASGTGLVPEEKANRKFYFLKAPPPEIEGKQVQASPGFV